MVATTSTSSPTASASTTMVAPQSLQKLWRDGQRVSTLCIMCGILLIYVVVSTANFLTWFPPDQKDQHNPMSSLEDDFRIQRHRISGKRDQSQSPVALAKKARWKKQQEIDEALDENLQSPTPSKTLPFSLQDRDHSPPFSIFYNVYFPPDQGQEGLQRSVGIVREQMEQVGVSYAASFSNKPVTVFYNSIGRAQDHNRTLMSHICADEHNILCIHMEHFEEGFEKVTLQKVYDYCHYLPETENPRITYMHNKGSYHMRGGLANSDRQHLTMAITHQDCLNPPDASCNACGLLFYTVWSMIFPGNFWTSQCNHIRKLHSPAVFDDKMKAMMDTKRSRIRENPLYEDITPNSTGWAQVYAKDRYTATHWIGSHPSLQPCDLTTEALEAWYVPRANPMGDFSWGMIPRPTQKSVLNNYALGNLFKWYQLYNQGPPDNSWLWRSFPDGQKWKDVNAALGNRTVDDTLRTERMRQLAASRLTGGVGVR